MSRKTGGYRNEVCRQEEMETVLLSCQPFQVNQRNSHQSTVTNRVVDELITTNLALHKQARNMYSYDIELRIKKYLTCCLC